jgi:hypothetical protein
MNRNIIGLSGMAALAAAAGAMTDSIRVVGRGYGDRFGYDYDEPRMHFGARHTGGNSKWPAGDTERAAKRKAQRKARQQTRKHRK